MKRKKLGEVLRERGQISVVDLASAVAEQQQKVIRLGELLLERELVKKADLVSALEEVTRIPYRNCAGVSPDAAILALVPKAIAIKCAAFPIERKDGQLSTIMAEPQNLAFLDEIRFTAGMNITPLFGFRTEILGAIEKQYGNLPSAPASDRSMDEEANGASSEAFPVQFVSTSERQSNKEAIHELQAELAQQRTPAVRIFSEAIQEASEKGASGLHIEPQAKEVIIRIRVDGVLRDLRREPRTIHNALVSRIKILADMDIADRRTPQDGRFLVRMGAKEIETRVSTLPTQYGEKVVIRLLDPQAALLDLAQLQMPERIKARLREALSLPQGLLLVTGPTGSGKSTTLYAALNFVRRTAINVVTVEDPVEYVLPGINQVHVNVKAGLTFAGCLRSILRQDPNVIMVGEIRDKETAEIAIKAAQTGHLVLSTLHTNDSLSAITRLLDIGIAGYMIAPSVTAIMAQRLVRRLCSCRQQVVPTPEITERLAALGRLEPVDTVSVAVGCSLCDHTGYKGRIGIYEILWFDETIREAIRSGASLDEIRGHVATMGMKTMQEDAMDRILEGITSAEEVARVVPVQALGYTECPACFQRISRMFKFCPRCGAPHGEPDKNAAILSTLSREQVVQP